MRKQIRSNVFETNSSSMHAICISRQSVTNIPPTLIFHRGEFGWEFERYSTVSERASYLYEAIQSCYYGSEEEIGHKINHVINVLADHGCKGIIADDGANLWCGGYIDHGGETQDFIRAVMEDDDKLIRWLFGDSFVITGNDNCDYDDDYYQIDINNYDYYFKGN